MRLGGKRLGWRQLRRRFSRGTRLVLHPQENRVTHAIGVAAHNLEALRHEPVGGSQPLQLGREAPVNTIQVVTERRLHRTLTQTDEQRRIP